MHAGLMEFYFTTNDVLNEIVRHKVQGGWSEALCDLSDDFCSLLSANIDISTLLLSNLLHAEFIFYRRSLICANMENVKSDMPSVQKCLPLFLLNILC